MANNAIFTTGIRKYTQCVGTYEIGYGVRKADGTYPSYKKIPVLVQYTETTKVCRALTSAAVPTSGTDYVAADWSPACTMDTITKTYGTTGNLKSAYFDYEKKSVSVDVSRVTEGGFYNAVSVVREGTPL